MHACTVFVWVRPQPQRCSAMPPKCRPRWTILLLMQDSPVAALHTTQDDPPHAWNGGGSRNNRGQTPLSFAPPLMTGPKVPAYTPVTQLPSTRTGYTRQGAPTTPALGPAIMHPHAHLHAANANPEGRRCRRQRSSGNRDKVCPPDHVRCGMCMQGHTPGAGIPRKATHVGPLCPGWCCGQACACKHREGGMGQPVFHFNHPPAAGTGCSV